MGGGSGGPGRRAGQEAATGAQLRGAAATGIRCLADCHFCTAFLYTIRQEYLSGFKRSTACGQWSGGPAAAGRARPHAASCVLPSGGAAAGRGRVFPTPRRTGRLRPEEAGAPVRWLQVQEGMRRHAGGRGQCTPGLQSGEYRPRSSAFASMCGLMAFSSCFFVVDAGRFSSVSSAYSAKT